MSGYLLGVIGVVLFCSLVTIVLPHGKTASIVHNISRLACIVAILAPIPSYFVKGTSGFFQKNSIEADEEFIKYSSELRIREAEEGLQQVLCEKYGEGLQINLYWGWEKQGNEESICVYQISVSYPEQLKELKTQSESYILENYGVATVFYEN